MLTMSLEMLLFAGQVSGSYEVMKRTDKGGGAEGREDWIQEKWSVQRQIQMRNFSPLNEKDGHDAD